MTCEEFNKKYEKYLEKGFYGLAFDNQRVIDFLDSIFKDLTKIPGFSYSQIKCKFGTARFYSNLESSEIVYMIENTINILIKK